MKGRKSKPSPEAIRQAIADRKRFNEAKLIGTLTREMDQPGFGHTIVPTVTAMRDMLPHGDPLRERIIALLRLTLNVRDGLDYDLKELAKEWFFVQVECRKRRQ